MIPKVGDVLDWYGVGDPVRWRLLSPLTLLKPEEDGYSSGRFKYTAMGETVLYGNKRDLVFEELDITPDNSNWRFVEDPFVLFVREVLQNAEAEKR